MRKQLRQRAAAVAADADACTFRPDTGNAVQVLALSAARAGQVLETEQVRVAARAASMGLLCASQAGGVLQGGGTPSSIVGMLAHVQERIERLAGREAAQLAARRAAKEAEVYASLDFAPQLNPRSRALAPGGSGGVAGLAGPVAERQRARLEELRREAEEQRRAECTFQASGALGGAVGPGQWGLLAACWLCC